MFNWIKEWTRNRRIEKAYVIHETRTLEVIADGFTKNRDTVYEEFQRRHGYVPINQNILFCLVVEGKITTDDGEFKLAELAPDWAKERVKQAV